MNSIVRAWSVPLSPQTRWDHTYVTAEDSNGDLECTWGCFGRASGGIIVAEVQNADVEAAKIAAGERGTAGIIYSITGVNHQAANRILFAAGHHTGQAVSVKSVRGYQFSRGIFGPYGKGRWPFLEQLTLSDRNKSVDELPALIYESPEPSKEIVDVSNTLLSELIKHLEKHPDELNKVRPRQFEELIAELLSSFGWQVELTPASKDGGYDIYAIMKNHSGVSAHWIVECKKYSKKNRIEVDIIRALYGTKNQLGIGNAMLATTSFFTKGARDFKESVYDLDFRDRDDVMEWIKAYIPNINGTIYSNPGGLITPKRKGIILPESKK